MDVVLSALQLHLHGTKIDIILLRDFFVDRTRDMRWVLFADNVSGHGVFAVTDVPHLEVENFKFLVWVYMFNSFLKIVLVDFIWGTLHKYS